MKRYLSSKRFIYKLVGIFIFALLVVFRLSSFLNPTQKRIKTPIPSSGSPTSMKDWKHDDPYGRKTDATKIIVASQLHLNQSDEMIPTANFNSSPNLSGAGVVLIPRGGMGNQLFQYACSYALAKRRNWPLYFDLEAARDYNVNHNKYWGRGGGAKANKEFVLDKFRVIPIQRMDHPEKPQFLGDKQFFSVLHDPAPPKSEWVALDSSAYCQSELYWKEYESDIRAQFQVRMEHVTNNKFMASLKEKIKAAGNGSVAVHVRRGDFLDAPGAFVPMSFQRRAIRLMIDILKASAGISQPVFFLFSDEPGFLQRKLADFEKYYKFVSVSFWGTTPIDDFYLMTTCKHFIVPASTFSWWAAYLSGSGNDENSNKVVIASAFNPLIWNLWKDVQEPGGITPFYRAQFGTLFHRKEWIVIDPFTGGLAVGHNQSVF